jgi:hypothetical protein
MKTPVPKMETLRFCTIKKPFLEEHTFVLPLVDAAYFVFYAVAGFLWAVFYVLLTAESANRTLAPIGFCIIFLIGSKYQQEINGSLTYYYLVLL